MRVLVACCGLLIGLWAATHLSAGEYNNVLNIGDKAPAWKDLPGVDDKKHSLEDLKDKQLVIVVFFCNSCDVSNDYEERINALTKKYADQASVVAINVNTIPADKLPKMKERAKEKKFEFAYLYDESQKIATDYGASFTPEFFLLDKNRKVAFMGGMDDNSDAKVVKEHYLEDAIDAVLKGEKPKVTETVSIGCRIRFASTRRKKS